MMERLSVSDFSKRTSIKPQTATQSRKLKTNKRQSRSKVFIRLAKRRLNFDWFLISKVVCRTPQRDSLRGEADDWWKTIIIMARVVFYWWKTACWAPRKGIKMKMNGTQKKEGQDRSRRKMDDERIRWAWMDLDGIRWERNNRWWGERWWWTAGGRRCESGNRRRTTKRRPFEYTQQQKKKKNAWLFEAIRSEN